MPDPYEALLPEMRAAIELDALPKDEANPITRLDTKAKVRMVRKAHIEARKDLKYVKVTKKLPPGGAELYVQLLADAYRNKCAGDEWLRRGNQRQADEFFAQETELLERAEAS